VPWCNKAFVLGTNVNAVGEEGTCVAICSGRISGYTFAQRGQVARGVLFSVEDLA
jgi:hypothetical protein